MRVTIRQKLILSFLLVSLLVAMLGLVSYSSMNTIAGIADTITKKEVPNLLILAEMEVVILEGLEEAFAYLLLDDPTEKLEFSEKLEQFDIAAAVLKEESHIGRPGWEEETELFNSIVSRKEALKVAAGVMFDSYEKTGVVNLSHVSLFEATRDALMPLIDQFILIESGEVIEANEAIDRAFQTARTQTAVAVLVAIVLAIGLGVIMARLISVPINRLRDAASRVRDGDLDTVIDIRSRDEIGDLALSFSQMTRGLKERTAGLERSNAELEEFAYISSHDLQEPLRKIRAFASRLEATQAESFDDTGRDYLARMTNAAARMQALIDDLLSYAKISSKGGVFRSVDLNRIAEEVLEDLEVAIEEAAAQLEVGDLPTVDADPTQMRQLLQNLVGNAIKFRRPGEPAVVRVGGIDGAAGESNAEEDRDSVRFVVEDDGIGFEPQYADRIFNVFQRLHGRSEYEGTGIGLAVCMKIAQRHGGTITATGQPGQGARFVVSISKHLGEGGGARG